MMDGAGSDTFKPEMGQAIFHLFDTEQTGHVSYRQCIQALAVISFEEANPGRDKVCFALLDPHDGKVSKDAVRKILEESWGGEQLDLDAFAQFASQSDSVYRAILGNIPEAARFG